METTENENAELAGNNSNNNATTATEAGKSDDQQQPQLQPGTSGIQHAQTQGVYIEKQLTLSREKPCKV